MSRIVEEKRLFKRGDRIPISYVVKLTETDDGWYELSGNSACLLQTGSLKDALEQFRHTYLDLLRLGFEADND